MVAVVVGVAVNGSRLAGYVAALSAGAWFDFFLTKPYDQFAISSRASIQTEILLVLVGCAVTEIAVRGRRSRSMADEEAHLLARIEDIGRMVAAGEEPHFIVMQVAAALTNLLNLRDCRFERDLTTRNPSRIVDTGDVVLAGGRWPTLAGRQVDLVVKANGVERGRFVLTPTPGYQVPLERRRVAVLLAGLAGAALAGSETPPGATEPATGTGG